MKQQHKPVIAGNWKMNTNISDAQNLAREITRRATSIEGVSIILCPPFISLELVKRALAGSSIQLGAQNFYPEPQGAWTGEIAPSMLKNLVDFAIIGHSERRTHFGETDDLVNRKILGALANKLSPIICVGETLSQREKGDEHAVVGRQLQRALDTIDNIDGILFAYEPVWAIGTGKAANPSDANNMMAFIRKVLSTLYTKEASENAQLLYGGSVSAENAATLFHEPEVDGALVGGASLDASSFLDIVKEASSTTKRIQ
jgi:triosephosphate isomerase